MSPVCLMCEPPPRHLAVSGESPAFRDQPSSVVIGNRRGNNRLHSLAAAHLFCAGFC